MCRLIIILACFIVGCGMTKNEIETAKANCGGEINYTRHVLTDEIIRLECIK